MARMALEACREDVNEKGNRAFLLTCDEVINVVIRQSKVNGGHCINIYDTRLNDPDASGECGMPWPSTIPFLNDALNVRSDIHQYAH